MMAAQARQAFYSDNLERKTLNLAVEDQVLVHREILI